MAFTDNPLISNMFASLGMSHLIPGQAGDTDAAMGAAVAPGHSKPNIPEYKNRPYAPRPLESGQRGGQPGTNPPMVGTQVSQDTLHSPQVADLLGRFGVSNDVNVDPHLFIHNQAAWANHPIASGILEGALSGAAFTHGGDTIGDSISGVAQGLLGSQQAHIDHINSQLMAPFQQAQAVATLQKEASSMDEVKANQAHAAAMSDYYKGLIEHYKNEDDIKQQLAAQKKTYDDQLSDLKNQAQDPYKLAAHNYLNSAHKELVKRYGSEDAIPSAAWNGVLTKMNSELYSEKNAWHIGAQGATAGREETKNQLGVLKDRRDKLEQEIGHAQSATSPIVGNDGKLLVPGSKQLGDYIMTLKQQRDSIDAQQAGIAHLPAQTVNPMAPLVSPSNASDPAGILK